jgi:hypothetical protein
VLSPVEKEPSLAASAVRMRRYRERRTPYMPITSDGDGEALRCDIEDSFKEDPEAEWRDIIEAAADGPF